eukprot:gene27438-4739_t
MSTAKEKPTLAGVQNKTRKRNIVVPVDPQSFADAITVVITDCSEEALKTEAGFDAATKALDVSPLDFARYGDTLFELFFSGGRILQGGDETKGTEHKKLPHYILACEPTREAIQPFVRMFSTLARRRPFLVRGLENTLIKLLLSLEFFNAEDQQRIAVALALVCNQKISVVVDNIFNAMNNDRLIAKGTILEVMTTFMKEFLKTDTLDDLVVVLTKAKVADKLIDFFPPTKRTYEEFTTHLESNELGALVTWNSQREVEAKITELQQGLSEMIHSDPPTPPAEVLTFVKVKKEEHKLPEAEVLRIVWVSMMQGMNMTGKNQQQVLLAVVGKIKAYHKILATFATSGKLELSLLNNIQVYCYEDNRLLKQFSDIVRLLYNADILGEDTIRHWHKKGSHLKGRNVFLKDIEPFMTWLDEAEDEEESEDEA